MPSEAKCSRSNASRAAASSSGKHSSRLRAATRRRARHRHAQQGAERAAEARAAAARASARNAAIKPMPSQAGQCRGPSGGRSMGASASLRDSRGRARSGDVLPLNAGSPYPSAMRKDPIERLLRGLYSAALYVLTPVTAYHLIWRGFRQRDLLPALERALRRVSRLQDDDAPRDTLWLHAVSVGEVNAAAPVVNALRKLHPDLPLLVTTITPTGSARVRALWGDMRCSTSTCPTTCRARCGASSSTSARALALVMETELWPNLLFGCRDHGVPTYILNARLSARSLRGYRVLAPLVGARAAHVAARRRAIAGRRAALRRTRREAANRCSTLATSSSTSPVPEGLDDFRRKLPRARRRSPGLDRGEHARGRGSRRSSPCIVACATRLRTCCCCGRRGIPSVSAPRSTMRTAAGWRVATRRLTRWPGAEDDVFVVDTLGELMSFYAVRGGRLRRRQPAAHRRAQPARTGGGRHGHRHRPAPAQLRRHRATPGAGACRAHRAGCRWRVRRSSTHCSATRRRAGRWSKRACGSCRKAARRARAHAWR